MNAKGLSTNELLRDKRNYGIYFFNIYGSGLQIIKEQFKYEVNTGLRQNVFLIDLHDIEEQGKNLQDLKKIIAQQIQECRKKYDFVMRKIQEEMKFDLHQYWLKSENTARKPVAAKNKDKWDKTTKKASIFKSRQSQETKITCDKSVVRREHNQVGRPEQLSWRKYIKDEPTIGKLYIIILGPVTEQFYKDLLRDHQPIEGILNLLPQESKYDMKLGNNEMRNFIMDTINHINTSVYQLRQMKTLKPVGIFFHSLPVISTCLASKYAANIFDQLTWITYDVETLQKQYDLYYYKPFQLTDVAMPDDVDIKQLYHVAETLSLQGHFLTSSSQKYGSDFGTIAFYLNSLLNACGLPDIVWKNYKLQSIHPAHSIVLSIFRNSFANVTKFDKFGRLIVDDNNKLLLDMLQFTDLHRFRDIHSCCMDYNVFRNYIFDPHKMECSSNGSIDLIKSFVLPKYIKYYSNKDCNFQRIKQLIEEYDDYQIDDIVPGYKLYTFKKIYNSLIEKDSLEIIPTRLCFRDFTLFQMEEFLFNLTPKPNADDLDSSQKGIGILDINENIFIRKYSLKAAKLQLASSHGSLKKIASKNTFEKRSSQTASTVTEEENFGLPPNHRLLKGYNLEDILQEIKCKTSKFNYRYGFVQLYEERWCFQDMNKQLKLDFNDTSIIFNTPRYQDACLDNSVYLVTKNDIGIRILNESREYNKIILNYPNGLSIFYQNYHNCEQKWISDECSSKEQRRIYTPYGCIIVYFKSNDMILIMRYNGEIYQLLQYELESEEEQSLNTEVLTSFQDQSSGIIDMKAQGDTTFSKKRSSKDTNQTRMSTQKIRRSRKSSAIDPMSLKSIIQDELRYLEFLIDAYELNYLHLIVTNTQGKRVTINRKGKISAGPTCKIKEWRDYFANEDYCERSDGVKMIWTKDCFKCYHKDGTLFTTRTEEGYATAETDEFDSLISQSSSHGLEENADEQQAQRLSGGMQKRYKKQTIAVKPSFSLKKFITDEGNEEHETEDTSYISYSCCSFLMENNFYAGVDIFSSELSLSAKPTKMELFCLDNIRAYIVAEPSIGDNANIFTDWETDILTESEEQNDLAVNIWIGENLNVTAYEHTCKIFMQMNQLNAADESQNESNSLTLTLIYNNSIHDAFKYLVNEIASSHDFCEWKMKEAYFIEKVNSDSTARGFEFLTALPPMAQYICQRNNALIELKPVITMDKLMSNNYDWHENDLKKFPRFKELKKWGEAAPIREIDFPFVLSANVFIEIPKSLRTIGNITKFLESFEGINFKKHRRRFRSVLKFYLKPIYDETLRNYISTQHWKKRRWEHLRRLFVEQQRLGLYYAMLKYKKFPNYWKFITEYKGEVRWIEFFDFVQNKCESKKKKEVDKQ